MGFGIIQCKGQIFPGLQNNQKLINSTKTTKQDKMDPPHGLIYQTSPDADV